MERGQGQYETGDTLTTAMYDAFKSASPYGAKRSTIDLPTQAVNIDVSFGQFALGDSNYPISPKLKITNRTQATLPGGTEFQFDYSTSAPANAKDQSGFGTTIVRSDHKAANNIGGLKGDYNRVSLKLPAWQTLAPGASVELDFVYYLPTSTPSNWTVTFGGKSYALAGTWPGAPPWSSPAPGRTPRRRRTRPARRRARRRPSRAAAARPRPGTRPPSTPAAPPSATAATSGRRPGGRRARRPDRPGSGARGRTSAPADPPGSAVRGPGPGPRTAEAPAGRR